jgi:hypothetical protein
MAPWPSGSGAWLADRETPVRIGPGPHFRGGVAEWLIASVLKTAGPPGPTSSNLVPSANTIAHVYGASSSGSSRQTMAQNTGALAPGKGVGQMDNARIAEAEILSLMDDAEQVKRRAEQRIVSAQRDLVAADQELVSLQVTLDAIRRKHGIIPPERAAVSTKEAAEYFGKSTRQMAFLWAERHDGEIVLRDMCRFFAAAGLFTSPVQAHGTMGKTIRRMSEFQSVARGVYRLRERGASSSSAAADPTAVKPWDAKPIVFTGDGHSEVVWIEPDTDEPDTDEPDTDEPDTDEADDDETGLAQTEHDGPAEAAIAHTPVVDIGQATIWETSNAPRATVTAPTHRGLTAEASRG